MFPFRKSNALSRYVVISCTDLGSPRITGRIQRHHIPTLLDMGYIEHYKHNTGNEIISCYRVIRPCEMGKDERAEISLILRVNDFIMSAEQALA